MVQKRKKADLNKRRARPGYPTKFTPENCKKVLHAIRLGVAIKIAVKCGGWSHETFYKFIRQGEVDQKGPYYDFACEVETAKGERAVRWLQTIEEAAKKQWQAAAWKLERLYPDEYGRVIQRQEHTGPNGAPLPKPETHVHITLDLSKLTDDELELYHRVTQRGQAAPEGSTPSGGNGAGETSS